MFENFVITMDLSTDGPKRTLELFLLADLLLLLLIFMPLNKKLNADLYPMMKVSITSKFPRCLQMTPKF